MNITQEQRDLTAAIVEHADSHNPNLDTHTESLIRVLGSVIEGVDVIKAMGAPGDWGYGTPIGDALFPLLKADPNPTHNLDLGPAKVYMIHPGYNDGDQISKVVLNYNSKELAKQDYDQIKAHLEQNG